MEYRCNAFGFALAVERRQFILGFVDIAELGISNDRKGDRVLLVWNFQHDVTMGRRNVLQCGLQLLDAPSALGLLELRQCLSSIHHNHDTPPL